MACQRTTEIHRLHDGELSSGERDQTEAHLRDCAECRRLSEELTGLSSLLSRAALATAPDRLLLELRRSRESVQERMVIRLAGWLTAAAAAVILGALITWPATSRDPGETQSHYQIMAVMPPARTPAESTSDPVLLAQWMADEFSPDGSGDLR